MEEFWKDINHVPLITTTTHSVPCSSSSSTSPPPPPSAFRLHEFFTQPLLITSDTNPSLVTSSASLFPNSAFSHSKRLSESDGGNRRSKRMIKNRESAARSRARKQAYTNELEQKLALLKEENAQLTKQLEQVDEASATDKHKLKRPPYRTLTAPF